MKKLIMIISLILSTNAIANSPYNYTLPQTNPFEAMRKGMELGKKQNDPNAMPTYGKTGLPANCRAYIQYAINSYRQELYTADDTMAGIERNCGINGYLWSDMNK